MNGVSLYTQYVSWLSCTAILKSILYNHFDKWIIYFILLVKVSSNNFLSAITFTLLYATVTYNFEQPLMTFILAISEPLPRYHVDQSDGGTALLHAGVRDLHGEPLPQHLYNTLVYLPRFHQLYHLKTVKCIRSIISALHNYKVLYT